MPGFPLNSIGDFAFLRLEGEPLGTLRQEIELFKRAGVNGTGAVRQGFKAEPFTLRSMVDAPDQASGWQMFFAYHALVGGDPVELVWRNMPVTQSTGAMLLVLDCRVIDIATLAAATAGLNPPSLGWLEAEWDIVMIPRS